MQVPGADGLAKSIVNHLIRRRFDVRGRVQGVGFRPFVCRLATELRLAGCVGNDPQGAFIEVEGPDDRIESFAARLRSELPPLARISDLISSEIQARGDSVFRIALSSHVGEQQAEIAPDAATCDDCLRELFDPADRRYRYPFINCTNCGPRYSIIRGVPYDRPNTTMSRFRMCLDCQREYDDPNDRRFHAQPNACPVCGPRVWLADREGCEIACDPIADCVRYLQAGQIVAIKGIGGFHLACRADGDWAVSTLRARKGREAKPLAVMVGSLEAAETLVEVEPLSAVEMTSPHRPIVLMPRRAEAGISDHVAPGNDSLGIMLPYTPLHHLLFADGLGPLVMTSANPTDEPLCCRNDEAIERLAFIADVFLLHDRDIERRVDDSVIRVVGGHDGGDESPLVVPIRRARGYAPEPIRVPVQAEVPVLAVGGELKSAVCLLSGDRAVMSEHLGELHNPATYRNFIGTIERFRQLLKIEPRVVAYDMHPDYAATRYALGSGLASEPVQHHHAHIVSCMAEAGVTGEVIGVSCDGTGYGTDGAIWGCEILVCDEADYVRAGHLMNFRLAGGDAAAKETWRPALALLMDAYGDEWVERAETVLRGVNPEAVRVVSRQIRSGRSVPMTSSLGRLFDAVACMLGVCDRNRYEAEGAMVLEALARGVPTVSPLAYELVNDDDMGGFAIDVRPMVHDLIEGRLAARPIGELSAAFHATVVAALADAVVRVGKERGIDRVVLSGGCFANGLLLGGLRSRLRAAGFAVHAHREVPTGDGGLALGQAVVAAARQRRRVSCV